MTIPEYLLSSKHCEKAEPLCYGCSESVKQNVQTGRWYITMGHPGFNTPSNNANGYSTATDARRTVQRYAMKKAKAVR